MTEAPFSRGWVEVRDVLFGQVGPARGDSLPADHLLAAFCSERRRRTEVLAAAAAWLYGEELDDADEPAQVWLDWLHRAARAILDPTARRRAVAIVTALGRAAALADQGEVVKYGLPSDAAVGEYNLWSLAAAELADDTTAATLRSQPWSGRPGKAGSAKLGIRDLLAQYLARMAIRNEALPRRSRVLPAAHADVLSELVAHFDAGPGQVAVLHGAPGSGKSHVALEYAQSQGLRYDLVWWLRAGSIRELDLDLSRLGRSIELRSEEWIAERYQGATVPGPSTLATDWLQSHGGWLIILDGVVDATVLQLWVRQLGDRGHVIATASLEVAKGLGPAHADLGWRAYPAVPLGRRHAVEHVARQHPGVAAHDAGRLFDGLAEPGGDGEPAVVALALDIAASVVFAQEGDLDAFLVAFTAAPADEDATPLRRVIGVALDWLALHRRLSAELLAAGAVFGNLAVPFELFTDEGPAPPHRPRVLPPTPELQLLGDSTRLRRTLVDLARMAMVSVDWAEHRFSLHPEVAAVIAGRADHPRLELLLDHLLERLAAVATINHERPELTRFRFVLHCHAILDWLADHDHDHDDDGGGDVHVVVARSHIRTYLALWYRLTGFAKLAGLHAREARADLERLAGLVTKDKTLVFVFDHLRFCSIALRKSGDYELAGHLLDLGLDAASAVDMDAAAAGFHLERAFQLRAVGKYQDAYEAATRAKDIWEQLLGSGDPLVADALAARGKVLFDMYQFERARTDQSAAAEIRATAGAGRLAELNSRYDDAWLRRAEGDLGGAIAEFERLAREAGEHQGDADLRASIDIGLARLLTNAAEFERAQQLLVDAESRWHRMLGSALGEHTVRLRLLVAGARLALRSSSDVRTGIAKLRDALDLARRIYDTDHPETHRIALELHQAQRIAGDAGSALAGFCGICGMLPAADRDPRQQVENKLVDRMWAFAEAGLGNVALAAGDPGHALDHFDAALAHVARIVDHRLSSRILHARSVAHGALDQWTEAFADLDAAAADRAKLLPDDHYLFAEIAATRAEFLTRQDAAASTTTHAEDAKKDLVLAQQILLGSKIERHHLVHLRATMAWMRWHLYYEIERSDDREGAQAQVDHVVAQGRATINGLHKVLGHEGQQRDAHEAYGLMARALAEAAKLHPEAAERLESEAAEARELAATWRPLALDRSSCCCSSRG